MFKIMLLRPLAGFLFLILPFGSVWGNDEPLTYDRINLSVSASVEVENDKLVAVLYFQREGSQAKKLADEVNRSIGWAVEKARKAPEVKVQTLEYHTNPIYRDRTLTGWRVRQAIRLESRDAGRLSQLIGELQENLAVQSVGYDVSAEKRKEAENGLIAEAIEAFEKRAALITRQLERSDYRLVRMDINTSEVPVRPIRMHARAMAAEASVAPPTVEAGTQTVTVSISGTIELQL